MATLSKGEVYALAIIVGMKEPKKMAAIAMAESSGRTDVVNSIQCVGLWQVNYPVWVKSNPTWTIEWLKNPFNNAIAAKKIQSLQGLDAWEAYTGPDGQGSDGPWRQYENSDPGDEKFTHEDVDMSKAEFDKALKDKEGVAVQPEVGDLSDALNPFNAVDEVLKDAWESVTNPAFWMRLAYGATGAVLIIGGLLLIVKNSSAMRSATASATKVAGATPIGRAATAAKKGAS